MALQLKNNAATTLGTSMLVTDTSLTVATGTGAQFPTLGVTDYFYCCIQDVNANLEIVKVTAISGDTFTITRAQEGTTARAFAAGSVVALRITAQTFLDTMNAAAAAIGPPPGIKNFLHNPGISVAQRGTTGSLAANTGTYCPDRWIVYSAGSTASWTVGTSGAPPLSPSYLYIQGATGNTGVSISQRLEATDCAPLVGKTVTLSLAADCQGAISTLPVTYYIYAPNSVDNWAGGYSAIATGTFATINTAWSRYSVSFVMPASAANGLQITFTFGAVPASAAIAVGGFQLELGSVMTSIEIPCKALELQRCQRYFFQGGLFGIGRATSATVAFVYQQYPVQMRAVPSLLTLVNGTNAIDEITIATRTITAAAVYAGTAYGSSIQYTVGAGGMTNGNMVGTNNALVVSLSAEL